MNTTETIEQLAAAAEASVKTLEQLPLGEAYAELEERADAAVLDLEGPSLRELFPPMTRVSADAIEMFRLREERFRRAHYAEDLAQVHLEALDGFEELAQFARSQVVVDRVRDAAEAHSYALARNPAEYADEVEARCHRLIAAELMEDPQLGAAAAVIAVHAPALRARIEAAVARQREHAGAETQRMQDEAAAVERAVAEANHNRTIELITFFSNQSGRQFIVKGQALEGHKLAAMLRGEGVLDEWGYVIHGRPTLEELEAVRDREIQDAAR